MSFGWGDCEVESKFLDWGRRGAGVSERRGGRKDRSNGHRPGSSWSTHLDSKIMREPLPSRPAERII